MFRLNRKVEYALIALKHMSHKRPGELTSAGEVADLFHCPFDATARVMQTMAQKGVLKSEQGAQGGYQITRDLKKMSFYDLWACVLGPVHLAKCLEVSNLSPSNNHVQCELHKKCNIVTPVHLLNIKMVQFFKSMTVYEFLDLEVSAARAHREEEAVSHG